MSEVVAVQRGEHRGQIAFAEGDCNFSVPSSRSISMRSQIPSHSQDEPMNANDNSH
jgi:hypothetical protein